MPDAPRWPYEHEVKVRWRDLDAAGHVNNAVYFTYMEDARVEAFFAARGGADWRDLDIILAHISCDFVSPATMHEVLLVRVRPTRIGSTSFALSYEISERTSGRLVARGESVQLMFDYARNVKKPVPDEFRKALEAGVGEGSKV